MLILAKLAGIVIIVLGAVFVVSTAALKKLIAFWDQDKKYYGIGLIRAVIGVVLLLAARQAAQPAIAATLGGLMLMSAVVIFALGEEKMKALFNWYTDLPDLVVRLLGIITVIFGVLIVLSL